MLETNPTLRHYPLSLERFGKNPYGDHLYRIVFAPSRRSIVFGEWPDGANEARLIPTYSELGNVWVLERWLSAAEFARCDRATWDATLSILGPYPERGEYEKCHVFALSGPDDANLDKLISWIEEGQIQALQEWLVSLRSFQPSEPRSQTTLSLSCRTA